MQNYEELHQTIPQASVASFVLERQGENRSFSAKKFVFDPHVSKSDQVEFYSGASHGGSSPQESLQFQVALDDFIIVGDESKKMQQMKDFLMEWFRVHIVKITDPEVGRIARDQFEVFYVATHALNTAPQSFRDEYSVEIQKVLDASLDGRSESFEFVHSNFERQRTKELTQVSEHVFNNLRYYADCEFQLEEKEDYLGVVVYTDFDFFRLSGYGIDFDSLTEAVERYSRASTYEIIINSEVRRGQEEFSVVDLRDFESVKEILDIHLADFEDVYDNIKNNSSPIVSNPDNFKRRNYFDEGVVTYDSEDNVGLLVGVDVAGVLRAESRLYRLVKDYIDSSVFPALIKRTKFEEFKVLRRRVQPVQAVNSLGVPYIHIQVWEREEWAKSPDMIVVSKDNESVMVTTSSDKGRIKEISFDVQDAEMVRFFSVKDSDAHTLTDGYYQYGVCLKLRDGLRGALMDAYGAFKEERVAFDRYHNEIFARGKYNSATMSVDEDFVAELDSREDKPWHDILEAIREVLILIGRSDAAIGVSRMSSWISPQTLTAESLGKFEEVVRLIEDKLVAFLSVPNSPKSYQEGGMSGGFGKDHSLYVEHWFTNQIVDSNFQRKKGLAYVQEDSGETGEGIFEVRVPDFVEELKDRFDMGDQLLGGNLPPNHFLPKDIMLGGGVINIDADTLNAEMMIYGNNMNSEIQGGSVFLPPWRKAKQ